MNGSGVTLVFRLFVLPLIAILWAPFVWSGGLPFCVTNAAQLQSALSTAGSNGQSDEIRIAIGTYDAPAGGFVFAASPSTDANTDLEISGGWAFFQGNSCGQRPVSDPQLTILDGGGTEQVLWIALPENGNVTINNLTFANGSDNGGGGLRLFEPVGDSYSGAVSVSNNLFVNNQAEVGGGLSISIGSGADTLAVRVLNNMFLLNSASTGAGAGQIGVVLDPAARRGLIGSDLPVVVVAHNTILNNDAPDAGGIRIFANVRTLWVASNNIWDNADTDLQLGLFSASIVSDNVYVQRNNIEDFSSLSPPDIFEGNISVAPQYESCGMFCLDKVPVENSPLIDAGFEPFALLQPWSLPGVDLNGNSRVTNAGVDIGAYEGRVRLLQDRFEEN
jgi:hypothetical protein